jgi:hypothetical protein
MGTELVLPFTGTSARPDVPSFQVTDSVAGIAVDCVSTGFNPFPFDVFPQVISIGVRGTSTATQNPIPNPNPAEHGLLPQFTSIGVQGISTAGAGVSGHSTNGSGVDGDSANGTGVKGQSAHGTGVSGAGPTGVLGVGTANGVVGQTNSATDAGVNGTNSGKGFGVFGGSQNGHGVEGHSVTSNGLVGFSNQGIGVVATGGLLAGRFVGNVEVTGDIRLTVGQDCAENFDVAGTEIIEAGTVMVIDQMGTLQQSERAYDKRVAGVVSGAGDYKPAILLGTQVAGSNRTPIALLGKVYCKVDARYSPVEVGDMLTTSPTAGHAMKAGDPLQAFGAVIGKALRPWPPGRR